MHQFLHATVTIMLLIAFQHVPTHADQTDDSAQLITQVNTIANTRQLEAAAFSKSFTRLRR